MSRSGANLYEALNAEVRFRGSRQQTLATHMELSTIEKALKEATAEAENISNAACQKVSTVTGDEANVQAKIDKKLSELERAQKRLRQMKQLRPAYQDELEEIQAELKILYDEYVIKYRNAVYLESLYEEQRVSSAQHDPVFVTAEIEQQAQIRLDGPGLEPFDDDDLSTESEEDILLGKKFYRKGVEDSNEVDGSSTDDSDGDNIEDDLDDDDF